MSADERPRSHPHLDRATLKKQFDVSNFDLNAILRGFQLTLVGGRHHLGFFEFTWGTSLGSS